jgi:death-on-curing family protein
MWVPDTDDVLDIHRALVGLFKDDEDTISPPGARDVNLLHSACSRPLTGIGDQDKYEADLDKAGALFHSLVQNHAFHNGNKRTAIVTLLTILYRNGFRFAVSVEDNDIYDFVCAVAQNKMPGSDERLDADHIVAEIARWLKERVESRNYESSEMWTQDFVDSCVRQGARAKESNGSIVVSHGARSVRISQSTRKMSGPVTRTYLRRLGLNEVNSGISLQEFSQLDLGERDQIRRYMMALKRLAKT